MLVSCGQKDGWPQVGIGTKQVLTQEVEQKCTSFEAAAKTKFDEANENPNITLDYFGIVYGESDDTCYLKMQITDSSTDPVTEIYSLFNTKTEQTYKNYTSAADMELGLVELIK